MKKEYRIQILAVGLVLTLASCNVTQKYKRAEELPLSNTYRDSKQADSSNIAHLSFKEIFTDVKLQELIQQGLDNNLDLKIAVARIKAASANLKQSKAAFLPTLTADVDYTLSKNSSAQLQAFGNGGITSIPSISTFALTGTSSWEADIWGKLRSNKKAVIAAYLQSEAYRKVVQTQLVSDIASNYYALMAYDKQLEIIQKTIEIRSKDISTVKALKDADQLNGADVVNSEANLYAAEVSVPDIIQSIRETENVISVLVGKTPNTIERNKLDEQVDWLGLETGVPLQLLSNRPDVIQAEYALINKFELTNVARTYFYPQLTISATGGWATVNTLKGFFDGTFYGNLISGLTQPIFNQGINKQRLKVAEATHEEAFNAFKSTILNAQQEVANALSAYQTAKDKSVSRTKQITSLNKSVDFTKELLKYTSTTNYTDVLTAETNLLTAQLNSVNDKLQECQSVINLYRALGGGSH